jgi:hypothetical protein
LSDGKGCHWQPFFVAGEIRRIRGGNKKAKARAGGLLLRKRSGEILREDYFSLVSL